MGNPIEDIFAKKNYRLLYFVTIPQGKALKMGQTLFTFIGFKARLEQAEVWRLYVHLYGVHYTKNLNMPEN